MLLELKLKCSVWFGSVRFIDWTNVRSDPFAGIAAFEMEYSHWIDEQERKITELKNVLHTPIGDVELRLMVENVLNHYCDLFRMKRDAARADAFYLVSGMWRTSVERFFLWIGGFKPSELINVRGFNLSCVVF